MKKFEFLVKNNIVIQKIYTFLFTLIFRFIGIFIKVDKHLMLFSSFSGKSFNDSPKLIYESLINNDAFKDYKYIWAFCEPKKYKGLLNCKVVKQDSFVYFIAALKAGYWITNVNIERGLRIKRRKTFYLNTWHGTGPKTSGNLVKNRKDYNFSNVDAILTTCEYHENLFIKGFNAKPNNLYRFGRPREDYLFTILSQKEDEKIKLLNKYNFPQDKKYILFAPTWRESLDGGSTFSLNSLFDFNKYLEQLGSEYVILFRAHSITNSYNLPENSSVIDVTEFENINELYVIADYLVSDYSSCFSDFAILEKPMFCFAPDYDEYYKGRGLLFDLNSYFTHGVIKNSECLIKAIKNMNYQDEVNATIRFKQDFAATNGGATEKVLNLLLNK